MQANIKYNDILIAYDLNRRMTKKAIFSYPIF